MQEMDVITRNFFRLLRSGAWHEDEALEPMSHFKWERLGQMVHAQHVEAAVREGLQRMAGEEVWVNIPDGFLSEYQAEAKETKTDIQLSNRFLNSRFHRIIQREIHAIDTNVASLDVLKIIVNTVDTMLNNGVMIKGLLDLGRYLRTYGDHVDFVKLDTWLSKLHLQRMAQLQGSMLVAVFNFETDELPFVRHLEISAYKLVLRSVYHTASDTAEEWHFRQSRTGFVTNNSQLLRRNLRRSLRYLPYAPIETVSNYFNNFTRSLQEIEE
jgi:hypothetical protein